MKYTRILISVIAVTSTFALLWHARASADPLAHYHSNLLTRAERALERGRPDRVLELLDGRIQELRRASHRAGAHALICLAWYDKGAYDNAERACDTAVQLDAGALAWSHLNNRGVMRLLLGRVDEALDDFQAAAVKNPRARVVRRNVAAYEGVQSRDLVALSVVR